MDRSADLKAKGNAAFQAQDYPTAVLWYSEGIAVDGANHVLFSNRSAAFAGWRKYGDALEDADTCISLKPAWGKGYARRGAAHHGLGDLGGALQAYKDGLTFEPGLPILLQGLTSVGVAMERASRDTPLGGHKSLDDLRLILVAAGQAGSTREWREVLKLEYLLENLQEGQRDDICLHICNAFIFAHTAGMTAPGLLGTKVGTNHTLSAARLQERQVQLPLCLAL